MSQLRRATLTETYKTWGLIPNSAR